MGPLYPGEQPADESERQVRLSIRNQCLLARSYATAGFVPLLDYPVVTRRSLDRYRRALAGLDQYLVVLHPGREVALRRDRERPEKTVAEHWVHMEDELIRELTGVGLWIESGALTVEQTVEAILCQRARAGLGNEGVPPPLSEPEA